MIILNQSIKNNAKLCYMDTGGFIINIKTEDFYEDIANDVEKKFDASNYEVRGKSKKVIGLMKDKLGGKIMTEVVALKPKTYSYFMDDNGTQVTKKKIKRNKEVCYKTKT